MRERSNQNNSIIQIHPSFYIIALGFVLTGYYLNLIIFTSLILFHEFGHFTAAKLCQAKVKKIVIYPYGGKTILEDYLNRDIHQEIFIASSGVIFQFIYYLFICFLHQKYFIRTYTMNLFTLYNSQMIFFNLLPIYPLDGGKIVLLIIEAIRRKPLDEKYEMGIQMLGFGLMILLSVYVTFNDIHRII